MTHKISYTHILSLAILGGILLLFILPGFAHAQNLETLQLRVDQNPFGTVLQRIINIALLAGGIAAFLFVLFGGFLYLTAGGDAARAETGRKYITNAFIGIVIILLSFTVVRFIVTRTRSEGTDINLTSPS